MGAASRWNCASLPVCCLGQRGEFELNIGERLGNL